MHIGLVKRHYGVISFLLAAAAPARVEMVFGGDLMFNGISAKTPALVGIHRLTRPAGVAFANLEIPLTNQGRPTAAKPAAEIRARDQFVLRGDPRHTQALKASGFDVVSLGNNHTFDYGLEGFRQMRALLDRAGILHSGAGENLDEARRVAVFTTPSGVRVGMVSALGFIGAKGASRCTPATPKRGGVHWLNLGGGVTATSRKRIEAWLAPAKAQCDVLVVAMHWGTEKMKTPTPYQVSVGRALVDSGADVVWGHHPHVLQGAEVYKGKPILYSAGNLVSPLPGQTGFFRVYFEEGKFKSFRFFPAQIRGGKVSLTSKGSLEPLSRLLAKRFPHRESRPLY